MIYANNLFKKLNPLNWYEIQGEMLNNSDEFSGLDNTLNVDFCIKLGKVKLLKETKILELDAIDKVEKVLKKLKANR